MKQYKTGKYVFLSIVGFVIFGAGLVLVKLLPEAEGIPRILLYICVGIGAGVFGGWDETTCRFERFCNCKKI